MDIPIFVPVVAHRLFGTKYVPPAPAWPRRGFGGYEDFIPGTILSGKRMFPVIDMNHGTTRSQEEIGAFFAEAEGLDYAQGWTVSRMWREVGVTFLLVGIVDEMIESDRADFISRDTREEPNLLRFNEDCAINIYFCRELEGRWGTGHADVRPCQPGQKGRILISDRWLFEEGSLSRRESWRRDVIVLAHELGHALTLPHMDESNNVMYGGGITPDSTHLSEVQGLIAKQHGRHYRTPWQRHVVDWTVVEVPYVRRYMGETLPSF